MPRTKSDRKFYSRHRPLRDGEDFPDGQPQPPAQASVRDSMDRLMLVHAQDAEVVTLTAAGYTIPQISSRLNVSESTVVLLQKHGRSILRSLLELG